MHKTYKLLCAIAKEIQDEIRNCHGKRLQSASSYLNPTICFECHTEEAWAAKLGEILQRHDVDLQQFIQEVGGSYHGYQHEEGCTQFQLIEGKLHYVWGDHFCAERLLFHIARVLPPTSGHEHCPKAPTVEL